jgi:hypothetical protein
VISREKLLKIRGAIQDFDEKTLLASADDRKKLIDNTALGICEIVDPEVPEPPAEGATRPVAVTQEEVARFEAGLCYRCERSARCRDGSAACIAELLGDLGLRVKGGESDE